jgi:hypothetical protein
MFELSRSEMNSQKTQNRVNTESKDTIESEVEVNFSTILETLRN